MQKHNRRAMCPSRDEVAELAEIKDHPPPELPKDVVEMLRRMRNCFASVACKITDEGYAYEWNREGLALDFAFLSSDIEMLLQQYSYSIGDPPYYW